MKHILTLAILLFVIISFYNCGHQSNGSDASLDTPEDSTHMDMSTEPGDPALEDVEEDVECVIEDERNCDSDADCGGRPCVRVPDEPGGAWYCTTEPWPEAETCNPPPAPDECCSSTECTDGPNGGCFYRRWTSGGPPDMQYYNKCVYDECTIDADCTDVHDIMCWPGEFSTLGRSRCIQGSCRVDTDCRLFGCGVCRDLDLLCVSHPPTISQGRFCIYPGECATRSDCEYPQECLGDWDTGATFCDGFPCPT